MDGLMQTKNTVLVVLSAAASAIAAGLGGWDGALQILLCFMAADYLTGIVVAGVFKKSPKSAGGALESRAGFKGLIRKGGILLCVFVGALLDGLLGAAYARTAVCCFFVANEGLSVLENIGLMGVPLPRFLHNMLEALRQQADAGRDGDTHAQ